MRDTKGYKVARAFKGDGNTVQALVVKPDGTTVTVNVPDWADKDDIRQEAARMSDAGTRPEPQAIPELED